MLFSGPNSFNLDFAKNSTLVKLIYINLAAFIIIQLLHLPFWLMGADGSADEFFAQWLAVPSDLTKLLYKPWTLISNMFLHMGLAHLLINMLWLYFLGQLFVQFIGEKRLWTLYITGGIGGAALFIIFFNIFPAFAAINSSAVALGASASVMAIIVAVGTYAPNHSVKLLFIGIIKLKYIAIICFVLDIISISKSNSGGHIAHIGGAAIGYLFAKQWLKGNDISAWVGNSIAFVIAIFKPSKKKKMKVKHRKSPDDYDYKSRKKDEQTQIDAILDKISRSGYDSLSKREKELLFKESNKN